MNFKLLGLILLTLLCWLPISSQAQVNKNDWKLHTPRRNNVDLNFSATHTKFQQAYISIEDLKEKMQLVTQEIELPTPDGHFETFEIQPVQVVANEVKDLYTIKTFRGTKKGDATSIIACNISDQGFHAAVYDGEDSYFIEPIHNDHPEHVAIFYNQDRLSNITCHVQALVKDDITIEALSLQGNSNKKRSFRLAIAATSTYCNDFGGEPYSDTNVLNALAAGVNLINPIFLRDVGIEFTLVTNNALIFADYYEDPYDMYDQDEASTINHEECVNALGEDGFDIGHVIGTEDEGGVGSLACICDNATKGEGVSSGPTDIIELWVDLVSHELGHQLGSEHNFSSEECANSYMGHRFEPGEGSTIMCYVGVCEVGPSIVTTPYFHYNSIKTIRTALNETACTGSIVSGNTNSPIADAKADITIPKETPFILVGSATDENDGLENLTYNWHQWEGSGEETVGQPNCENLDQPLFKYVAPSTENHRSFPQYIDVLAGNNHKFWEKLPCVAGEMDFSLAVRDNNTTFGRIAQDIMKVNVADTGPFEVSAPNGGETIIGGTSEAITWTVNGTDAHCPLVDVLFSSDRGVTYTIIADGIANNGSALLELPNIPTTKGRILVRCDVEGKFRASSTFFDVSNNDFVVEAGSTGTYELAGFSISIFPNPTSKQISIIPSNTDSFAFELIDLNGRIIKAGEMNQATNINVLGIPAGLYYLRIVNQYSGKAVAEKIVIE